jgi:hypothetical protein
MHIFWEKADHKNKGVLSQQESTSTKWPRQNIFAAQADASRVARFFLVQHTKTGKNIPNDYKIDQMTVKYTKWPKIYQMTVNVPNDRKYAKWPEYIPNSRKIEQMATIYNE